jgi:hypothetical protein
MRSIFRLEMGFRAVSDEDGAGKTVSKDQMAVAHRLLFRWRMPRNQRGSAFARHRRAGAVEASAMVKAPKTNVTDQLRHCGLAIKKSGVIQ